MFKPNTTFTIDGKGDPKKPVKSVRLIRIDLPSGKFEGMTVEDMPQ